MNIVCNKKANSRKELHASVKYMGVTCTTTSSVVASPLNTSDGVFVPNGIREFNF